MKVILLAAGRGRRFGRRTATLPKCLIPLGRGSNLLTRYLDSFRKLGLRDIAVVVGHQKEKIVESCVENGRDLSIKFLVNPEYRKGSLVSLFAACGELDRDCLIMDADVWFRTGALAKLLRAKKSAFLLDPRSKSSGEEMMVMARDTRLACISKRVDARLRTVGEAVGFLKLKKNDARLLAKILEKMVRQGKTHLEYEESFNELMKRRRLGYEKIAGFWREMDFEEDLAVIRSSQ